jgi:glutamine amidotransferase/cyclase
VTIPVIAYRGTGCAEHFLEVFTQTKVEAALAAGIFHMKEIPIGEVEEYLKDRVEIPPG